MYKRICTPIVTYKTNKRNYCVDILDISVITSENRPVNLYHAEDEIDCMEFDYKSQAIGFILKICSMYGYRAKIVRKDDEITWYNIQWVDIDNYNVNIYAKF